MKLRTLLLALLSLFFGLSVAFCQDTYYLTDKQLNELIVQINNLQSNNKSMTSLLDLQMSEYEKLQKTYEEKSKTTDKQLKNYQELLSKSKDRELIYKYGIGVAFVVGLVVGIVVAK